MTSKINSSTPPIFSIISLVKKITGKHWTILALILAIGFFIYPYIFKDSTNISIQIVNQSNVFDLNKPVDSLFIFFKGEDLRKSHQNLKIITLRIINDGDLDILQGQYDHNLDWGIEMSQGIIIEISKILSGEHKYLSQNINPVISNDRSVIFNKVVFEKNKYFPVISYGHTILDRNQIQYPSFFLSTA